MARDLRNVLDAVLDGVIVISAEENIEEMNASACRILACSAEQARGQKLLDFIAENATVADLLHGALRKGRSVVAGELWLARPPHTEALLELSAAPLFDEHGAVDGAVLWLRDRRLQADLRARAAERDRLSALGRIATGIAHEVKNPLGGIRGAGELIETRSEDVKTRKAAEIIVREVDRITALLDELMVFGSKDELRPAPANLHRVLDHVIELLELDPRAERIQLQRNFDPSIPEILADADRLTQVFLNLARNALEAMEGGDGELCFATATSVDRRLTTRAGENLPSVRVDIRDNGPGIPEELHEQVALPFFTTKERGTGLGLAISQYWVTMHDGNLRLFSKPGQGTTARVELPLRRIA